MSIAGAFFGVFELKAHAKLSSRSLLLIFLLTHPLTVAYAQMFQCPAGSTSVMVGGGMMCQCSDGSYAGLSGCKPQAPVCPGNAMLCRNLCCSEGNYCSVYGCISVGSRECGGWSCSPEQKCSVLHGRCVPSDAVDCGEFYCPTESRCAEGRQACLGKDDTDCGTYQCGNGKKCASGDEHYCIAADETDCGAGKTCKAGFKCLRGGGCVLEGADDCGNGNYCKSGQRCGSQNTCLAEGDVDCGNGKSCPSGKICPKDGGTCLTSEEVAQQVELEKKVTDDQANRDKKLVDLESWLKKEQSREAAEAKSKQKTGKPSPVSDKSPASSVFVSPDVKGKIGTLTPQKPRETPQAQSQGTDLGPTSCTTFPTWDKHVCDPNRASSGAATRPAPPAASTPNDSDPFHRTPAQQDADHAAQQAAEAKAARDPNAVVGRSAFSITETDDCHWYDVSQYVTRYRAYCKKANGSPGSGYICNRCEKSEVCDLLHSGKKGGHCVYETFNCHEVCE